MVSGVANGHASGLANGSAKEQVSASDRRKSLPRCSAGSVVKNWHIFLQVFLVFGKSGWIGGLIGQLLKERGLKLEYANARLEERSEVIADIERVCAAHCLCSPSSHFAQMPSWIVACPLTMTCCVRLSPHTFSTLLA